MQTQMKNILVVDDEELNRKILAEILCDEYVIHEAENGKQALEFLEKRGNETAAVLLDLIMPEMDGFGVLEKMKEMNLLDKVPVLIISGESSVQTEKKCFEYGVSDFIRKPFDNAIIRNRTRNTAELFALKNQLEEKVQKQSETLMKQYQALKIQANQLKQKNGQMIEILGTVVENRSLESGEHIQRVKGYTLILARILMKEFPEYGLTAEKVEHIAEASVLHDVGKIAIPDSILMKHGKLTSEEFDYMKSHTTRGYEMLGNISGIWEDDYAQLSKEICRHHHERYDGRGYPDGLKGDEIPISAQLVSLADV